MGADGTASGGWLRWLLLLGSKIHRDDLELGPATQPLEPPLYRRFQMEPSGKKTSPLARALMVTFEPLMSAMRVLALAFLAESFAPE
eukprot:scaffold60193_cov63-Phaeocystis_antarctica.AAC.2